MFDEKGQLHTLEGVASATILLMVMIYAIDATSMTPLTASTSSLRVESELQTLGQDIFNVLDYSEANYTSKLKYDIINWNGTEYIYDGSKYVEVGNATSQNNLNNNLTNILSSTLVKQGIAHKVELTYLINSDNKTVPYTGSIIYAGAPSNNAVIVSRKIVLQDTDNVAATIPDIDPSSNLFNIVDIRLVMWRM
ncbi:MAG: hypothetical protein O8C55_08595 [Candidatus Methanoperedens sp.]|nr:hypothetical protein [Candidatus Methanoperedens sp.]